MTRTILGDVKGIDPELHRRAKAAAALRSMAIGQWYNLAIKEKLARDAKKERK